MANECSDCDHYEPHKLSGVDTGYGTCTRHIATQLKTEFDEAQISGTPIVWKDFTCSLFEETE